MSEKTVVKDRMRALPNDVLEEMANRRTQARTEVYKICSGERRWTMSIPTQMTDSDHMLIWALEDADQMEREIYRLRGAIKTIHANMDMPEEVREMLMAILFGTGEDA